LRSDQRSQDGKAPTSSAVVERERTSAGPRQRPVASRGERKHDPERRWQRTVVFSTRPGDAQQLRLVADADTVVVPDDPDSVRRCRARVGWTKARRIGDVGLAWRLWRLRGLDAIGARQVPATTPTCRPAARVASAVSNRLCVPGREFALAEHWSAATAWEDWLGVADAAVPKDRWDRTVDGRRAAQPQRADGWPQRLPTRGELDDDRLLDDLTSTACAGLAEAHEVAAWGDARDHRHDCQQVVWAWVGTRDGFPRAPFPLPGNTPELAPVRQVVEAVEKRCGRLQRVGVMARGMVRAAPLRFRKRSGRQDLLGLRRSAFTQLARELQRRRGWPRLEEHAAVEGKVVRRGRQHDLLTRS
jgi:hypothetical protein